VIGTALGSRFGGMQMSAIRPRESGYP
jgi:hypothetical protein